MATDSPGTGTGRRPARRPRHTNAAASDRAMGVAAGSPSRPLSRPWQLALRVAGAGLLAATAAIHLDLYLTGYRTIPALGWLFLLQVIMGFGLAAAVLASGRRIVAAAGAGFAVATLGGYLMSVWAGLFGFTEVRTTAGAGQAAAKRARRCGGGRWGVGAGPGVAGGRRRAGRRPGPGGHQDGRGTEDRDDRRGDGAGQCQGTHRVLVRSRHPGQVGLLRVLHGLLATGHRQAGRWPRPHRPPRHHPAIQRPASGHLQRASPLHLRRRQRTRAGP